MLYIEDLSLHRTKGPHVTAKLIKQANKKFIPAPSRKKTDECRPDIRVEEKPFGLQG